MINYILPVVISALIVMMLYGIIEKKGKKISYYIILFLLINLLTFTIKWHKSVSIL